MHRAELKRHDLFVRFAAGEHVVEDVSQVSRSRAVPAPERGRVELRPEDVPLADQGFQNRVFDILTAEQRTAHGDRVRRERRQGHRDDPAFDRVFPQIEVSLVESGENRVLRINKVRERQRREYRLRFGQHAAGGDRLFENQKFAAGSEPGVQLPGVEFQRFAVFESGRNDRRREGAVEFRRRDDCVRNCQRFQDGACRFDVGRAADIKQRDLFGALDRVGQHGRAAEVDIVEVARQFFAVRAGEGGAELRMADRLFRHSKGDREYGRLPRSELGEGGLCERKLFALLRQEPDPDFPVLHFMIRAVDDEELALCVTAGEEVRRRQSLFVAESDQNRLIPERRRAEAGRMLPRRETVHARILARQFEQPVAEQRFAVAHAALRVERGGQPDRAGVADAVALCPGGARTRIFRILVHVADAEGGVAFAAPGKADALPDDVGPRQPVTLDFIMLERTVVGVVDVLVPACPGVHGEPVIAVQVEEIRVQRLDAVADP